MFYKCKSLTSIPDISRWDIENVTSMSYMFCECSSLSSLPDISKWYVKDFFDYRNSCYECSSAKSNSLSDKSKSNKDDSSHKSDIYSGCNSLNYLSDISKKYENYHDDTNSDCFSLTGDLEIIKENISNIKDMSYMFYNCNNLVSLNLSSFDASSVTNFNYMFAHDINLLSLNLKNFKTLNVISMDYMFVNCNKINYFFTIKKHIIHVNHT
jgi:surface protein